MRIPLKNSAKGFLIKMYKCSRPGSCVTGADGFLEFRGLLTQPPTVLRLQSLRPSRDRRGTKKKNPPSFVKLSADVCTLYITLNKQSKRTHLPVFNIVMMTCGFGHCGHCIVTDYGDCIQNSLHGPGNIRDSQMTLHYLRDFA